MQLRPLATGRHPVRPAGSRRGPGGGSRHTDGPVRIGLDADSAGDEFAGGRRQVDRTDPGRRRRGERRHSRGTFLSVGCDLPSAVATT